MYVLPVVDGLVRFFGIVRNAVSQVDGQLADIAESSLIADLIHSSKAYDLCGGVLHQVDPGNGMWAGLTTGFNKTGIQDFNANFLDALVADYGGLADHEEGGDSGCLIRAMGSPDVGNGTKEGFQELAEGEEVGDELEDGVEEELLCSSVGEEREKVHHGLGVGFEERCHSAVFLRVGRDTPIPGSAPVC
jgi:hypothetical protein